MSLTVTDLFCGAGGSSIGAELAGGTLRLGLNHWKRAVETHATNFQHADHDCEDVASLTTSQIRRYPDSDILLASPECTNHSLAKGSRRRKPQAGSLFEDGPAADEEQDRSRATMWDVVRFAEQKLLKGRPYHAIIVENVVDAFKWGMNDDGGLFDAWLTALNALGYDYEVVWLNSMFCPPTPQSRDRLYVVFWRRGVRRPNLRFEPPAWCPHCERVVDGRQTWKRPGQRPWGRYGAQYFFSCPDCWKPAVPGAFAAASIIDRELPAVRIGDRARPLAKNTRERIRRGLERLATEPFAIRLTHGGAPRPLTIPLVTLTQRHDPAMVFPVAGNTYERSPGNRAQAAERTPLATVHGTADRALVVPPMGAVAGRDADLHPAPAQTTTTRAAIVQTSRAYDGHGAQRVRDEGEPVRALTGQLDQALVFSNRAHNVPRPADERPSHPVLTGEHLGVVEVQRNGGVRSEQSPAHTIRAGGHHHAVIVRNNKARGNAGQMVTPGHEPIRTLTAYGGRQSLVVPYSTRGVPTLADGEPVDTLTTRDRAAVVWTDEDIDACHFRMFALHEIAGAMGMRDHPDGSEYVVHGNKRERMAQYGNAVTPPAMRMLVERVVEALDGAAS